MTKLGLTLSILLSTTIAAAQPKPPKPPKPSPIGFAQATTFESCTKSWALACGKRDSDGRTFGTAHEMTHCQRYTFQPNGTYSVTDDVPGTSYGTYQMVGSTMRLWPTYSGRKGPVVEFVLSPDGATLGPMKRL